MKRTALIFATALIASPVFAADDLCSINLQKLDDQLATHTTITAPLKTQVEDLQTQAKAAQQAGNNEDCASAATQALTLLEKTDKGGEGAGS
ncbi:hypothetical protein IB229_05840 [Pseudomonas sp. PDM14]|uniref:hypothetical protein n=1 Tax=Pseudomonas sp. PDM14 TaxID=2769288 RepID=UPI0017835CC8|nr:hypothetical protein [Pseudomonas sp. PDM14]MBD9482481.1 hypothetical protein [Pseudomonas sp. PDM14]